ncbi:MAG: isopentenyl phosphate kinase family protein [Euryarchaeota archaeon]|nr:isopentenyl phosphate kinase family protein [Euryarchaeota archaeon]
MIIVKLGGSVITDKSRPRSFKPAAMKRLAKELAGAREELIVVHGAGSFGHHEAKRAEIARGYRNRRQLLALPRIHRDLRQLDLLVLDALLDAGLRPVSIPPAAVARRRSAGTVTIDTRPFEHALELGMVPVSFGDVIQDSRQVFSILSGDAIVERLSDRFRPRLVVFVTDVDGIFDKSPLKRGASLILAVSAKTLGLLAIGGSTKVDVTRGMAGKATEMGRIARRGARVLVVNGNKPGRLKSILAGKDALATEIHA